MSNLNNFSISTKLYLGFGLLGLFLLVSGVTGYRSTEGLGETLSFITGPAWETADGAMEGTIGLQQEMLGVEWLLSGSQTESKARQMMQEGASVSAEALDRMVNSGLIEKQKLLPFQESLSSYQENKQKLLQDYSLYQQALSRLYGNFYAFQQLMEKAEETGDGEVELLRQNPFREIAWNNGLKEKWEAADGAMEGSIHLLTRMYYFSKIIRNENVQQSKSDLDQTRSLLVDTLQEIIDHPVFISTSITHDGEQSSLSALIKRLMQTHLEDFDSGLAAYEKYQQAQENYTRASESLIEQIGIIEETGDGTVENVVDSVAGDIATSESLVVVSLLLGLIIGSFSTFFIIRSIKRPLNAAQTLAKEISNGNFDNNIECKSRDEVGLLVTDLLKMQANLKSSIEKDRKVAAENQRIRSALDSSSTPTTVSDDTNTLIYMNRAAEIQFKSMETAWRQTHPDFDAGSLIGKKLSAFFSESGLKQAYLQNLQSEKTIEGEIASRQMQLIASPVYGDSGEYVGRVTQWIDQTEKLAEEEKERQRLDEERRISAENQRIRVALDNVSSNVMLANPEREIIYINKKAQELFNNASDHIVRDLPAFDPSRLVGQNIDVFHKNPSHQMHLLEKLNATYTAEMEIGGLTMKIVANPVIDDAGNRLGTAVEWTDRTLEVATEREIDRLVEAAVAGDMSNRLDTGNKAGFFLELSKGFNSLLDELNSVFRDIGDAMGHMANGDLTHKIENEYRGLFGDVKDNVNKTIVNVESTVVQLRQISEQVSVTAGEITNGNSNLSSRTEQQASSLEETASSMEQLTSTVRNNSDNAQQANQMANTARTSAEQGGEVVNKAMVAMEQISESSNKISDIIGVIDEIAFQTNLLALNASVEAARAGEQGRGFAVVATEVRNLASRSAEAAKEIKELIKDSVEKVRSGSALVNETGSSLNEIVTGVKKVGDIIAEIAAASSEQLHGIEQVNSAVTQMDEMTQQNAALAEQTSAASANMMESSEEIIQTMSFFKTDASAATMAPAKKPVSAKPSAVIRKEKPVASMAPTKVSQPVSVPKAVDDSSEWDEF